MNMHKMKNIKIISVIFIMILILTAYLFQINHKSEKIYVGHNSNFQNIGIVFESEKDSEGVVGYAQSLGMTKAQAKSDIEYKVKQAEGDEVNQEVLDYMLGKSEKSLFDLTSDEKETLYQYLNAWKQGGVQKYLSYLEVTS